MAVSTLLPTASTLQPTKPSTTTTTTTPHRPSYKRPTFPILSLPIELRLKIYAYLFPPRTHTIVSDTRPTGLFCNSSPPASTTYPFGRRPSNSYRPQYRILTSNFHSSYPSPSIYPQLLRACKQIHAEAEPLLYGHKDTVFDFGTHSDALLSFFAERSRVARGAVREIRLGKEIHTVLSNEEGNTVFAGVDGRWVRLGEFVRREMGGVRRVEVVVWSSSGGKLRLPPSHSQSPSSSPLSEDSAEEEEIDYTTHPWFSTLLNLPSLREARIITWDFQIGGKEGGKQGFDTWLAERMVADEVTRGRMVKEGLVRERVVRVRGLGA